MMEGQVLRVSVSAFPVALRSTPCPHNDPSTTACTCKMCCRTSSAWTRADWVCSLLVAVRALSNARPCRSLFQTLVCTTRLCTHHHPMLCDLKHASHQHVLLCVTCLLQDLRGRASDKPQIPPSTRIVPENLVAIFFVPVSCPTQSKKARIMQGPSRIKDLSET